MDKLFTQSSVGTLAGCVAAVVVIVNTVQHVFEWQSSVFALAVAFGVAIAAYFFTAPKEDDGQKARRRVTAVFFVILNGCLIYASAFGIQESLLSKENKSGGGSSLADSAPTKPGWRSPWQRPF